MPYLPPETATRHNPFREWIGARLRVDVYGWAAGRRPRRGGADGLGGRARQPHRERRLRSDVHGSRPRGLARRGLARRVRRRRRSRSCRRKPARRGAPDGAGADGRLGGDRRRALRALRHYHWVHAINNTALVAAALYRSTTSPPAICGVVQGGWDTDTNGAAVGSILGALGRSRRVGRRRCTAASRVRFLASTAITLEELDAQHASRLHDASTRWSRGRSTGRPPSPARAPLECSTARRSSPRPTIPRSGRAWRDALRALAFEARARIRYDGGALRRPGSTWTQSLLLGRARLALGRAALRPDSRPVHARRSARRGRARVRRLRRRRALARVPGDRDRRAQPVRLLPRRPRAPRARGRVSGSWRPRVRRLQPVGHRHAARAGRRRRARSLQLVRGSGSTASSSTR